MIIGVDHVLIAVESVERAMETYRRLGFEVLAGGEHPRMGTYNALVPLADGAYLELIGVKDRAKAEQFPNTRLVVEALGRENRLATFALDTDDLPGDIKALQARGLVIGDPVEGERERPDGRRVAWRSAHFEAWYLPFLIQDVTPRELRVPPPGGGIGQSLQVAGVVWGARELERERADWQQLLGAADGNRFELRRGGIQLEQVGAKEELLRVVLAMDRVAEVAEQWRKRGVAFRETVVEEIGLILEPEETEGAPLQLIASASSGE